MVLVSSDLPSPEPQQRPFSPRNLHANLRSGDENCLWLCKSPLAYNSVTAVEFGPESRAMLCVSCFRVLKARLRCHVGMLESLTHGMQDTRAPLDARAAVTRRADSASWHLAQQKSHHGMASRRQLRFAWSGETEKKTLDHQL